MFSTKVSINTSYTFKEIVFGAKFKPMFSKSDDNSRTILHLNRLNEYEKVDLF
jgi:inward rectifier potassium channel